MPVYDSKRNLYPRSFPVAEFKAGTDKVKPSLVDIRSQDKREWNAFRPLYFNVNVVHGRTGSCYMEVGSTSVICSIHGPCEVSRFQFNVEAKLNCYVKFAPFSKDSRQNPIEDPEEKEMSQKIVKSIANSILLNEYPKSQIDIFIMVLHHDGSVLSAAINAAVVALCDSGILMKDLPMAASVLVGDSDIFLDPTASEEAVFHSKTYEDNYGIITATHMTSFDELSLITQDGRITGKIAARAIKVAIEGIFKMRTAIRQILNNQVDRHCRSCMN